MPAIASENYQSIRAQLVERGTNLRRWALKHKLPVGSVYNAVKGSRKGIKAIRICKKLEKDLQ